MTSSTTVHKNSKLFYKKIGNGPMVLLAFHGFGQDHKAFDLLSQTLHNYTLYSFDLYFHGTSEWNNGEKPLEKEFWKEVMETFLTENNINNFSLVGFSLGCRLVMTTVEILTKKINSIFLLAPDGININFWYTFSTYPFLLRKIFKSMIIHPARFKIIVNTLHELRVMDKGLLKFAEHQMNTEEKRKRVYFTWVVFRHLKFNIKEFARIVNNKNIPITIVVGKEDHVIPSVSLKKFIKLLRNVRFEILNTGHAGLLKDTALTALFNVNAVSKEK